MAQGIHEWLEKSAEVLHDAQDAPLAPEMAFASGIHEMTRRLGDNVITIVKDKPGPPRLARQISSEQKPRAHYVAYQSLIQYLDRRGLSERYANAMVQVPRDVGGGTMFDGTPIGPRDWEFWLPDDNFTQRRVNFLFTYSEHGNDWYYRMFVQAGRWR